MVDENITKLFDQKINKTETCWIWNGLVGTTGQPIFIYKSKEYSARMYSLLINGQDPAHTKPTPICENKLCINPKHLLFGEEARFWSKVNKTENCWIWIGGKNDEGYGKFTIGRGKKHVNAHRYSYELFHKVSPGDMLVCHHCDNTSCVNPQHLYLGTAKDNSNDKVKRGRSNSPVGSRSYLSKLKESDILVIRNAISFDGIEEKANQLAEQYNVKIDCIYDILRRQRWKHV